MNTRLSRLGLYCGAVALVLALLPWRPGIVLGESMSPTIRNGSVYVMDCSPAAKQSLQRGDVVVFREAGETYIKRIAAVGGDTIYLLRSRDESFNYDVVMDWQLPAARRAFGRGARRPVVLVARTLPPGMVFVLGDNLANSLDSRCLGPIAVRQIVGKMVGAPAATEELRHVAVHSGPLPDRV
ncbi:MAG: signal peptidase I [Armatimonadota bacterium]